MKFLKYLRGYNEKFSLFKGPGGYYFYLKNQIKQLFTEMGCSGMVFAHLYEWENE
jgi:hypothetical protein